jgi:hypothetical protein
MLLDIYVQHASLVRLIREFGSRPSANTKMAAVKADRQMSLLDL